ncbi:Cytochrome c-551 [bioreactor metagenome]|uniref:Cytochrome c-551 n=1 Tax=bioreactor metagenome TaxID=1076179 RepID=A0A645CDE3_9ZZZZ
MDKKLVGPAFKDVAAKYKGDAGALDKLATKVKAGGKGAWGEIPMPPNNVTPEEAKKLTTWILAQK